MCHIFSWTRFAKILNILLKIIIWKDLEGKQLWDEIKQGPSKFLLNPKFRYGYLDVYPVGVCHNCFFCLNVQISKYLELLNLIQTVSKPQILCLLLSKFRKKLMCPAMLLLSKFWFFSNFPSKYPNIHSSLGSKYI